MLENEGITCSLVNNLIASLKDCKIPDNPTLLGPFRNWIYPKTFRSSKTIKATQIKIPTNISKYDNNSKK